jgi:NTP pyrophosphatase (non-canonical NTP hydrolase)
MERGLVCVNAKVNEILDILQEECAEVIVAISKIRRFGIDNSYKEGGTQREHLVQELGDVTLLVELLKAHGVFTDAELYAAQVKKSQKLVKWSKIYED